MFLLNELDHPLRLRVGQCSRFWKRRAHEAHVDLVEREQLVAAHGAGQQLEPAPVARRGLLEDREAFRQPVRDEVVRRRERHGMRELVPQDVGPVVVTERGAAARRHDRDNGPRACADRCDERSM